MPNRLSRLRACFGRKDGDDHRNPKPVLTPFAHTTTDISPPAVLEVSAFVDPREAPRPQRAVRDAATAHDRQSTLLEDLQDIQHLDNRKEPTTFRRSYDLASEARHANRPHENRSSQPSARQPSDQVDELQHGLHQLSLTQSHQSQDVTVKDPSRRFSIPRKPVGEAPLRQRAVSTSSKASSRSVVSSVHSKQFSGEHDGFHDARHASQEFSPDTSLDMSDTQDTTVIETWAPAVTHEKVTKHIHHVREEKIYRDIHTHEVRNHILPVVDVQVLPARHFVPTEDGGLREITEDQIPEGAQKDIRLHHVEQRA
ncbi:hypothetical protein C1H76_1614 [Elsinoe australis]|uniref:Uncharacterized protein n=1 Tax=Elsinoe australis TaxID=40998 RepID=A0A4U7B8G5_9PEZI|nr:hypothetical protein C1H76_1614 [Elsinoe australis]